MKNDSSIALKPLSLKNHQSIMLELMVVFDDFCEEHQLRYYLAGGTLIGAVRHKGFIPWDDDTDVFMPRPDYEKLIRESSITPDIEIISLYNSHGYYHPFTYCNIVNARTIMVEHQMKKQTGKGVFLDIFPLDGLPDDEKERKNHLRKLMALQTLLSNAINAPPGFHGIKNSAKTILGHLLCLSYPVNIARKIDLLAKKYPYETCNAVVNATALFKAPQRFIAPKSDYANQIKLEFCGHFLGAPSGFDAILTRSFGDYMKLPPESEREGHHGIDIFLRS